MKIAYKCNDNSSMDSSTMRIIYAENPEKAAQQYVNSGYWTYSPVTVDVVFDRYTDNESYTICETYDVDIDYV